jgi:ATP-dependent DNA helicase RecQ
VLSQKILSAVARTGQRFGVGHVVAVLRGETSETVTARRHHELSVFGLLRHLSPAELRGYLDQLTQGGFLARAGDQYPTLHLTNAGAELLRGRGEVVLYRQPRPTGSRSRKPGARGDASWANVDQGLFEALRALRVELARARGVPPYVIFHDTTLRELARLKPSTIEALYAVTGIGARKAEQFGQAVLDVIDARRG